MAKKPPPKLQVVGGKAVSSYPTIPSPLDVENLDLSKLRETMMKGIYLLEAALFSQSSHEFQRIASLRESLASLEAILLDPKELEAMSPGNRIMLYSQVSRNLHDSMAFLQTLHSNVSSSLDTLSQIGKMKEEARVPNEEEKDKNPHSNNPALEQVKAIIALKIRERTT